MSNKNTLFLLLFVAFGSRTNPAEGRIVNLDDYQRAAKEVLELDTYNYALNEGFYALSKEWNRLSLQSTTLWPRYMRDVSEIDSNATVLGKKIAFPVGISPTAYQTAYNSEGEVATARACEALGNIYVMSYYSTRLLEDAAEVAPTRCRKWMDLYISANRSVTEDVITRAKKNGYEALVVTIDGVNHGRHYRTAHYVMGVRYPAVNFPPSEGTKVHADPAATWDTVRWIKDFSKMPVIAKGVLHPKDAHEAIEAGVAAVWVSNHGGGFLDTISSSFDALEDIVKEVKSHNDQSSSKVEIYTDGGYRVGIDLIKAFSLGVNYVFLGRPTLFMLAVNGTDGIIDGYTMMHKELRDTMQLSGYPTLTKVSRSLTKKCTGSSPSAPSSGSSSSGESFQRSKQKASNESSSDSGNQRGLMSIASSLVSSLFGRPISSGGIGSIGGTSGTGGSSGTSSNSDDDDSCD